MIPHRRNTLAKRSIEPNPRERREMESLNISADEYEGRFEKVRDFIRQQGLGALFVYSPPAEHKWGQTAHVAYLTGWANHDRIVDSVVVIPGVGPPALLFAGLPYMREQVADVSPLRDVRLVQAVDPNAVATARSKGGTLSPRDFVGETLAIMSENGVGGQDVGVIGLQRMPVPFFEALATGFGKKLKRVDDIVEKLRSTKSSAELMLMRRAAELSDLGFQTMQQVATPGMRGIEILAEMERAVRREGADHAKYWMASGPPTDWNDTRLDIKPHLRVLGEGDLMAACSYVVYKGYWCHGQRTGTLVCPSAKLDEILRVARQAQDAGLQQLRAGVPIGRVARTIRLAASKLGMPLQGGRIGHGIGMDYSEQPVPLTEANEALLAEGMTCVIHAAYSLPETGKLFVPLGDVCHVTASGPELLMRFGRDQFVAGT